MYLFCVDGWFLQIRSQLIPRDHMYVHGIARLIWLLNCDGKLYATAIISQF